MLFLGSLALLPLIETWPIIRIGGPKKGYYGKSSHIFGGYRQMLLYHSLLDAPALKQFQFQHNRGKFELYIII